MIQVFIEHDAMSFETGTIRLHVFARTASHLIIYDGTGHGNTVPLLEGAVPPQHPIILPADAAHPLLAALSRHLGAVEHPEQLRADYDHLRRRHDSLVDWMMEYALRLK